MNTRHLSISAALLFSAAAHAQSQNQDKPSVPPDLVDVSYGPHQRNVFDLWKAKSDRPTPLVIFTASQALKRA